MAVLTDNPLRVYKTLYNLEGKDFSIRNSCWSLIFRQSNGGRNSDPPTSSQVMCFWKTLGAGVYSWLVF